MIYTTTAGMSGYTWSLVGGTINSGQGTNTVDITWTTPGAQWISVNYTDLNGCTATTVTPAFIQVTSYPALDAGLDDYICSNTTQYPMHGVPLNNIDPGRYCGRLSMVTGRG
jgi:hypothetical protein